MNGLNAAAGGSLRTTAPCTQTTYSEKRRISPSVKWIFASTLSLLFAISTAAATNNDVATNNDAATKAPQHHPQIVKQIDDGILSELNKAGIPVADLCNDADFLRRSSLDITGQLPSPEEVAAFCQDQRSDKRALLIDRLLASPEFGRNWGRYWRDVIYIRATEQRSRFNQMEFEDWMAEQWNKGTGWDQTVTAMLSATGDVKEHPETALIFAQGAVAEEVAAESCRIFLGIQLQCANCHDHPSDIWKREQFHQLAAYFPRIAEKRTNEPEPKFEIVSVNNERRNGGGDFMRQNPEMFIASMDRNKDEKLSKDEMLAGPVKRGKKKAVMMDDEMKPQASRPNAKQIDRLFEFGDADKDGLLTVKEIKGMPVPNNQRRGSTEHHMVDLQHPSEEGKLIDPKFFIDGSFLQHGQNDEERRLAVARAYTSPSNPWFARAFVNRVWAEMMGEGFYMPVDDMGPSRNARYPEVLDLICKGFVGSGHDPKWLVRTIANTDCYQRKIQPKAEGENALPFASATPVPLRSDTIFNSVLTVFGLNEGDLMGGRGARRMAAKKTDSGDAKEMAEAAEKEKAAKPKALRQAPRFMFDALFGVDPSLPKDEITGTIPQSLLLMNSPRFRAGMSARGETRLGKILREHKENRDAIKQLFLLVLAREPYDKEYEFCQSYIAQVKDRPEAFEDIMWTLINSSEFISRR